MGAITPPPKAAIGVRHGQVLLMFTGLLVCYLNRISLSVGIVAMTDHDANPDFDTVDLSIAEIGSVSGAFFWGYAVSNLPGGMLSVRWGPRKTMALAMTICGLLTCVIPTAGRLGGYSALYFFRVLQGLGQGLVYPCVHAHMSKWCVPKERGTMFAIAQSGAQLGTVVIEIASGFLAASIGGWPSIFYFAGVSGIAWSVICIIFVADSPSTHRRISRDEKDFIETNLDGSSEHSSNLPIPWRGILTSVPFWSIAISHIAYNWAFWTLLTLTPTYLNGVYNFPISKNGFLSSIPYMFMFIFTIVFSLVTDKLNQKNLVSTHVIRKTMNTIAFWGGSVFLFLLGYAAHSATVTMIYLSLAAGFAAGVYNGFLCNHIDLSPNFSGVLMGITNGLSNISSILGPTLAGVIVKEDSNVDEWQIVFLIAGSVFSVGNFVFLMFGSTDIQPWNYQKTAVENKAVEQNEEVNGETGSQHSTISNALEKDVR